MNRVAEEVLKEREWIAVSKSFEQFDAVLSRFERKFGAEKIRWSLGCYSCTIGIAYVMELPSDPYQHRVAFKFRRNTATPEHCDAAIRWIQDWVKDPTKYRETVSGDNTLDGNEIDVASLVEKAA
jgi:hypothetical protein